MSVLLRFLAVLVCSGAVSYAMTRPVMRFAERIGAIDSPDMERRVNTVPVPRMGGLAIFFGFMAAMLLFVEMTTQVMAMLLGAIIIAAMGAVDDIVNLNAWIKLALQVFAAIVAVRCGIVVNNVSNPLSGPSFFSVGSLGAPLTVLWIVGCTNAVNLIDGLDGLAVGISTISSVTLLVVALLLSEPTVALVLAALTGACLGFLPYNTNPARIFMGDVGSQLLGYILATSSVMGLFKIHAFITFLAPMLALALPLADTAFAVVRRVLHGQSPFRADRGHIHHRLLALGLDQKEAVILLYTFSALLGLIAVLFADGSLISRLICLALAVIISVASGLYFIFVHWKDNRHKKDEKDE